ncbi:hypothetical protein D0Z07_2210 [Hyphodiscus hymeniophilus]|uniref:Uncharacterized protein n=1 Tax=Hyphodiscus hymeniophilus TaxID=353542 RepID=A0A9P6VLT4_9HELO|nr:hypothetical protein D0Z07_2210 [Hyphodiscus hymeniophilus]
MARRGRRDIVAEFERYFGNETNLANWQRLCHDVGIAEQLRSINQCRKALKGVWVNIYDLLPWTISEIDTSEIIYR